MDISLLMEYGWVLLVLVLLEGVLSADNALVLAIMVKPLPKSQRKKALFYGLIGAFIFRFAALFLISFLVDFWQAQAIGAAYLIFMALKHLLKKDVKKNEQETTATASAKNFWLTVLKVEVADIAFAVDSILAAVALSVTLTPAGIGTIGGLDTGQFLVILAGGLIGVIIMRLAATYFVALLHKKPGLEKAAFIIVGWVGVKLVVATLAHESLAIIDPHFPHSIGWKITFYAVLIGIAIWGWFLSGNKKETMEHVVSTAETISHK